MSGRNQRTLVAFDARRFVEGIVNITNKGWIEILCANDNRALWTRLYRVVSRHTAVRMLYQRRFSGNDWEDVFSDLTQELFLRLHQRNRLRSYVEAGYSDKDVEQELYRIEVPNMVSRVQRETHPESYRIARRISDLLQTQPEFQYYSRPVLASGEVQERTCNKMALKVYGLSTWRSDKQMRPSTGLAVLVKDIAIRLRDTRRTGRGDGSQIIISNSELKRLIVDLFIAIDTPVDVRTMRSLALSKLPVEDRSLVSLDASRDNPEPRCSVLRVDLPDERPTPLEVLLAKESQNQIYELAEEMLVQLWDTVRNKAYRYRKLIEVVWHCYFNPASPSQAQVAEMMGISCSLVSHYRRIFDSLLRTLPLSLEEFKLLDGILERRVEEILSELKEAEADDQNEDQLMAGSECRPVALYTTHQHSASL